MGVFFLTIIYNGSFFSIMCVYSQYYDDWACSRGISIITIPKKTSLIIYNQSLIIYNRSLIISNQESDYL
jgi:hypothetical protein